jgi:hypothetical protein
VIRQIIGLIQNNVEMFMHIISTTMHTFSVTSCELIFIEVRKRAEKTKEKNIRNKLE